MKNTNGCFSAILLVLAGIPVAVAANAALIMWYWGWFIVPLGVKALVLWQAAGMAALVSLLTHTHNDRNGEAVANPMASLAMNVMLRFGFGAFMGWFFHYLMVS